MRPFRICHISWCDVQINPEQRLCDGHLFLTEVERRKSDDFAQASKALLERIKAVQHGAPPSRNGAQE